MPTHFSDDLRYYREKQIHEDFVTFEKLIVSFFSKSINISPLKNYRNKTTTQTIELHIYLMKFRKLSNSMTIFILNDNLYL